MLCPVMRRSRVYSVSILCAVLPCAAAICRTTLPDDCKGDAQAAGDNPWRNKRRRVRELEIAQRRSRRFTAVW